MFASQGIQMVKPIRFDPERLARLEWNISKFLESEKQILVPEEAMIYKDKLGKEFLRFNTYDKKAIPEVDDNNSEESELENRRVELTMITEDPRTRMLYPAEMGFLENELEEMEIMLQRARVLDEDQELELRNGAVWIVPLKEEPEFEEMSYNEEQEEMNRERQNLLNRFLEDTTQLENDEQMSIISGSSKPSIFFKTPIEATMTYNEKVILEEASSSYKPFSGSMNIDSQGNIPPQRGEIPSTYQPHYNYTAPMKITHKGKPFKPDQPIKLQGGEEQGKILNFLNYPPQQWPQVLDLWKGIVWAECVNKYTQLDTDELLRY